MLNRLGDDPSETFLAHPSNARTPLHFLCRSDFGSSGGRKCGGDDDDETDAVEVAAYLISASHHRSDPVVLPDPMRVGSDGSDANAWDVRYRLHTSALTVRDYLGDTPLHCLCGHPRTASAGLVRLILDSASDAAGGSADADADNGDDDGRGGVDDDDGGWSVESSSSSCSNRRAPSLYDLVTARNLHGCTPLHFVAEGGTCDEIFRLIVGACRSGTIGHRRRMRSRGDGGDDGGGRRKEDRGRERSPPHPTLMRDDDGDLPLHFACSAGMSAPYLSLLLEDDPLAVHIPNKERKLPIDDLVEWFVDEYGGSLAREIGLPTSSGPPIAPSSRPTLPAELFELWSRVDVLLRATARSRRHPPPPAAAAAAAPLVWRPVHAAASTPSFPSSVLTLACRMFPGAVGETDERGRTPLHLAAANRPPTAQRGGKGGRLMTSSSPDGSYDRGEYEADTDAEEDGAPPDIGLYEELTRWDVAGGVSEVRFLVDAFPPAASATAADGGRLPLHLAVASGRPASDALCLLSVHPRALEAADPLTRLYPFMLAAAANGDDSGNVYGDRGGRGGGHDGCHCGSSVDVVYLLLLGNPELVRGGIRIL